MNDIASITERVSRGGHPDRPGTPTPLLSIDEFFEGNDCVGSIGCNLPGAPKPSQFYEFFRGLLERPDVADIRVQITAFDDPAWPFSDTVYIMTTASPEVVLSWFEDALRPDETWSGFLAGQKYEPYDVPKGTSAVACWWD